MVLGLSVVDGNTSVVANTRSVAYVWDNCLSQQEQYVTVKPHHPQLTALHTPRPNTCATRCCLFDQVPGMKQTSWLCSWSCASCCPTTTYTCTWWAPTFQSNSMEAAPHCKWQVGEVHSRAGCSRSGSMLADLVNAALAAQDAMRVLTGMAGSCSLLSHMLQLVTCTASQHVECGCLVRRCWLGRWCCCPPGHADIRQCKHHSVVWLLS
jgi:hypothetical protein